MNGSASTKCWIPLVVMEEIEDVEYQHRPQLFVAI